jgi:hypothetical protein
MRRRILLKTLIQIQTQPQVVWWGSHYIQMAGSVDLRQRNFDEVSLERSMIAWVNHR